MARYLLIESRDPFETDLSADYRLAADLAARGDAVTMFLVQNGVLPARADARAGAFGQLLRSGVEVLADDFSLRERGIDGDAVAPGVKPAPLEVVVDHLAAGAKTVWL